MPISFNNLQCLLYSQLSVERQTFFHGHSFLAGRRMDSFGMWIPCLVLTYLLGLNPAWANPNCNVDYCSTVKCATNLNCLAGQRLAEKASYCGCCDLCIPDIYIRKFFIILPYTHRKKARIHIHQYSKFVQLIA